MGADYAMWALITVKPGILPTSKRNRCPHQGVFSAHIHWNHLRTWTGILAGLVTAPNATNKVSGSISDLIQIITGEKKEAGELRAYSDSSITISTWS